MLVAHVMMGIDMSHRTASGGAGEGVMVGEVASDSADSGAFQAASCSGRGSCQGRDGSGGDEDGQFDGHVLLLDAKI